MPTLTQRLGGNALENLIETYRIPGQYAIDPTSTAFIWGQVSPVNRVPPTYLFNDHLVFQGTNLTTANGTVTTLASDRSHYWPTTSGHDHPLTLSVTGVLITGANFSLGSLQTALASGSLAAVQSLMNLQQWTFNGSTGSDEFTGGNLADMLYGGGGNDTLDGGAGNDMLYGGQGADHLIGGAGIDYARYDDANYGQLIIRLDGGAGTGAAAGDTYSGIEGLIGGLGDDLITGNGLGNYLLGGGGDDYIDGGGGNDQLNGGAGDDLLWGGLGADQHIGGDGIDYASYNSDSYGNLVINLSNPGANTGAAAGDTYSGIECLVAGAGNDTVVGDAYANRLFGAGGNDVVRAGAGVDYVEGGDGNDHLYGGTGADQIVGGAGLDYARYDEGNYGNLTIRLDAPSANTGAAAGDTYSGIECIVAGSGNDTIFGDGGVNRLFGMGGNDTIDGRAGSDYLEGGAGVDNYRFSTALGATNVDTIAGFQHGVDNVMLHASIFAGIGPTLTANEFGATSGAGRLIIYQQNTGRLFYDAGGAGVGAGPVQFATVTPGTVLDVNDFLMV